MKRFFLLKHQYITGKTMRKNSKLPAKVNVLKILSKKEFLYC
jgi:hypothetical protein